MATKKTQAEVRAALMRQVDELDLARVTAAQEILASPEVQDALEKLKALGDPTDGSAAQRSPLADVNALVANLCLPIERGTELCQHHAAQLDFRLNPPPAPPFPPTPTDPNATPGPVFTPPMASPPAS